MDTDSCAIEAGPSWLSLAPGALLHVPDHGREILRNQGKNGAKQHAGSLSLLHRLPAEIRLMILELVIQDATASTTGVVGRVNKSKCRCAWLADSYSGEKIRVLPDFARVATPREAGAVVGRVLRLPAKLVVRGMLRLWGDGRRVHERAFRKPADLSILRIDRQLAHEAQSIFFATKHFWLTSREALALSKRPAVVARLRWLAIYERDPAESVFFDDCCPNCDRNMRQGMLGRLLGGKMLQQLTIRLEPFYGRRIPADAPGRQGVTYLLHTLGMQDVCRSKCTSLGVYELVPTVKPCSGRSGRQCACSSSARRLRQAELLGKIEFEHALLQSIWAYALSSPDEPLLQGRSDAHERKIYHWRNRWQWRRQWVPFPHRCERVNYAAQAYACWIRWNVMLAQRGEGRPRFLMEYHLNVDSTHPEMDMMPGREARLLGQWTQRMAADIAMKIWDDPTFRC